MSNDCSSHSTLPCDRTGGLVDFEENDSDEFIEDYDENSRKNNATTIYDLDSSPNNTRIITSEVIDKTIYDDNVNDLDEIRRSHYVDNDYGESMVQNEDPSFDRTDDSKLPNKKDQASES